MSLCRYFKCKEDQHDCLQCYNGVCDGTGYDGHQRCGCDACEYHTYDEDEEICIHVEKLEHLIDLSIKED